MDLDFLRDLDQVKIVPASQNFKPNDDVTEPVNPSVTKIRLTGKAEPRPRDEWINLNVGGTRFLTCRSTLVMNAAQTGMLVSNDAKFGCFSNIGNTAVKVLLR